MPLGTYPGIPKLKDRACTERASGSFQIEQMKMPLDRGARARPLARSLRHTHTARTSGLMIRALPCFCL